MHLQTCCWEPYLAPIILRVLYSVKGRNLTELLSYYRRLPKYLPNSFWVHLYFINLFSSYFTEQRHFLHFYEKCYLSFNGVCHYEDTSIYFFEIVRLGSKGRCCSSCGCWSHLFYVSLTGAFLKAIWHAGVWPNARGKELKYKTPLLLMVTKTTHIKEIILVPKR